MNLNGDRRWTATITYAESDRLDLCCSPLRGETVAADLPSEDLQKSMATAAYAEAATFLLEGVAKYAYIQLFKTTKAHGTVADHTSYLIDVHDAEQWALRTISKRLRS
jgi:hypothetical protein